MDVLRGQIGQHEEWVFPYKGKGRAAGRPIGKIKTACNNARERAGLGEWVGEGDARKFKPNFRWHDFRHTFASWHAISGTMLEVLQKLWMERYADGGEVRPSVAQLHCPIRQQRQAVQNR